VDDEIAIVHQYPFGILVTLDADRQLAAILHSQVNLIADSLILTNVGTSANEEVIGEACDLSEIEDHHVLRFLGMGGSNCCCPVKFKDFQGLFLLAVTWGILGYADNMTSCPNRTTIKQVRLILLLFVSSLGTLVVWGQSELAELKQMEVDRLRIMAESGAIPRARLEQAQAELADAEDNAILRRTLYGTVRVEDFTKEQSDIMVAAAVRLVERQKERYERTRQMVDEGVVARVALTAILEDLQFREKALDLANYRAKLVAELAEQADAEVDLDETEAGVQYQPRRMIERYEGHGIFGAGDFARISVAFQRQFAKQLPVSAHGETALHRSLGFDHRGRVDIALNPDQKEGVWLRNFLQKARIPYYAFRAAVRGKATAPHIHLGPPSLRLRTAD
jgi:hypothetical protein